MALRQERKKKTTSLIRSKFHYKCTTHTHTLFMKQSWISASRRGSRALRDKTTLMIHFLTTMTIKKRQETLRKLINNRCNRQGVFFMLSPRSPRQLEFFFQCCGHDPCGRDELLVFKPVVASVLPLSTLISCPLLLSSLCFSSANPQSQI